MPMVRATSLRELRVLRVIPLRLRWPVTWGGRHHAGLAEDAELSCECFVQQVSASPASSA